MNNSTEPQEKKTVNGALLFLMKALTIGIIVIWIVFQFLTWVSSPEVHLVWTRYCNQPLMELTVGKFIFLSTIVIPCISIAIYLTIKVLFYFLLKLMFNE